MIVGCGSNTSTSSKNIELIKAGKYEEAALGLVYENDTLYYYCHARIRYDEGDYSMGNHYLDSIEDTYSGTLKEEVMNYKAKMKEKNIEYGFKEIADKNYDEAASWFFRISEEGTNLRKLYSYATSLEYYAKGDFSMAKSYAEEFSPNLRKRLKRQILIQLNYLAAVRLNTY